MFHSFPLRLRTIAWLMAAFFLASAMFLVAAQAAPAQPTAQAALDGKRCKHGKKRTNGQKRARRRCAHVRKGHKHKPGRTPDTTAPQAPLPAPSSPNASPAPAAAPNVKAQIDGSAVSGGPAGPILTTNADGTVCATGNRAVAFWYANGWEWFRAYSTCGFWIDAAWDGPRWAADDYAYWGNQTFMAQWPARGY